MKKRSDIPLEEELKQNGMLLRRLPAKERSEELCWIAVRQNPQAIKLVPAKLQSESLCEYAIERDPSTFWLIASSAMSDNVCMFAMKQDESLFAQMEDKHKTENVCRFALSASLHALKYISCESKDSLFPTCEDDFLQKCLSWIEEDISASVYLPRCVRADHRILKYQKYKNCLKIKGSYYCTDNRAYCVEVGFCIFQGDRERAYEEYEVVAAFSNFDEYYSFVDGNLSGAKLQTCDFEGVDLKKYNINDAVIFSDVLLRQGLYDHSYYRERFETANDSEPAWDNQEPILKQKARCLQMMEPAFYSEEIAIYYISDLHLWHRIKKRYPYRATKEEIYAYIQDIVIQLCNSVKRIAYNSFLLIAGDTSSVFEFSEVFYKELVKHWSAKRIVVVSGNHELLDPSVELDDNIQTYRDFFNGLGINYLQNELLCFSGKSLVGFNKQACDKAFSYMLDANDILTRSSGELHEVLCSYPLLVLGGIGFTGRNVMYNASNLKYGYSFDTLPRDLARQKDIEESEKFAKLYQRLMESIPGNRLIVLTHTPKEDWSDLPYVPAWAYISGHNHRNFFEVNETRKVFADNQVGYNSENFGLKYFITSDEFDVFAHYCDGIYSITAEQYIAFNRGKRIPMNFWRTEAEIYMLKRNGYYMFFFYGSFFETSKRRLYLLDGAKLRKVEKLTVDGIQYYFDRMEQYTTNVNRLLDRYTGTQELISQFLKKIGGDGKIHGCIIDVDKPKGLFGYSYAHLFVNPIDGTVTPYYARNVQSRIIYKDLKSLLANSTECKKMLAKFRALEASHSSILPVLKYDDDITPWGTDNSVYDEGGYLYRMSRIIKSLQYCTEKGIIRVWNEVLTDCDRVDTIIASKDANEVMDEALILDVDSSIN